ncbi:AAA family ATPase [Algoriphagus antarcticus]|uniref:ATPase family protein associated with various cellular activities (AAA) n=1 Tax=Algoriphagus antarcticus TaxID=238540 RepID=A0A3E0E1I4_9BACT|nr:AAA family ATPase [Algoriphagus antarcticus]REG92157.1 ATPase family protein associated with various cellular activities (AAA) [Algoriphagus antarcticus]
MKNFWHIQLHPNNQSEFPPEKVKKILEDTNCIGMDEWADGWVYLNQFRTILKIGDIVLVRSKGPLALVEVIGEAEQTPNPDLKFDWFENRRKIKVLQFFDSQVQEKIGRKVNGIFPTVTFASANTSEFIQKWYSLYTNTHMQTQAKSLLEYKKQIILQGPPGTGKTRLAKEIAKEMTIKHEISIHDIRSTLRVGLVVPSSSNYTKYTILEITDSKIQLQLENEKSDYPISFKDIQKAFAKRLWITGQKNGSDPYTAALSKYIFENLESDKVKLIQFHPAYAYEDFVRGIVVETEDGVPTYKSVNKIFAELAEKALHNYQDSLKSAEQVSQEKLLERYLKEFKEELALQIEDNDGKLFLKDTSTYLFQVEADAVRYTGDNWKQNTGLRSLFSDIATLYKSDATTRKDVTENTQISSLARSHASYTLRVLDLFKAFMKGKSLEVQNQEKLDLKSFVLIIDEINRANLPSVLGELIYGLEYRGDAVESIYAVNGDRKMIIPPNLYVIGTMNTADRSVGHIDYAIRRRFAFVDVLPIIDPIKNELAKVMFEKVSKLFVANYTEVIQSQASPKRASTLLSDFRPEDVWIGHSYFLTSKNGEEGNNEIKIKMKYEVLPLLKEYVKDGILRSNEESSDDPVQMVLKELNEL